MTDMRFLISQEMELSQLKKIKRNILIIWKRDSDFQLTKYIIRK